ncbi:MAG: GtrA family protein [Rhodobacterales bacterium]|nr:GtrA family protein [Rhodobacterales bacterium]MDX5414505.1 GtrA family protein [Rhodobacterales bacterium]
MQLLRFALVGGLVALAYVAGYLLLLALSVPQMLANGAAFLGAVALQYLGQAGFTFRRRIADRAQVLRFIVMIALGLVTATLITAWLAAPLGLSDGMAALAVALILPVQNYIFMTLWVFSKSRTSVGASL